MVSMNKEKRGKHLTKVDRRELKILIDRGYSKRAIAEAMNRGKSSIAEEIKNGSVNGIYDPDKASHKAYVRRKYSKYQGMKIVENVELKNYVEEKLYEDWSPELISGRLRDVEKDKPYVSPEGIRTYIRSIYGRQIEYYRDKKRKKRRYGNRPKSVKLEGRKFIDDRPKGANNRTRFRHFEGDFIVSNKTGSGALLVTQDRKSKYAKIRKLDNTKIATVHESMSSMLVGLEVNTITLDNDISFRKHEELSELIGADIYFCHPYHSWEKGGVERFNRMIREYIPKRSDISRYSHEYVQWIEDRLNDRPRACLRFKTPREIMIENNLLKGEERGRVSINSIKSNLSVCPV